MDSEENKRTREPIKTRQQSASQERRNSVSEITEFFQAKASPRAMSNRKTSGKNSNKMKEKEKDKERAKEAKEARENIRKMLLEDSDKGTKDESDNANGVKKSQHEDEVTEPCPDQSHEENACKSTAFTQTSEDEILNAIKELADKYQKLDEDLNDPKNGIGVQLAKTKESVTKLYTGIHGAVSGIEVRLQQVI